MAVRAAALLLAVLVAAPSSQAVSRVDRLEQWLTAIERHESGTPDPQALAIRAWNADDLRWLWIDLHTVITLIRDPDSRIFYIPSPRSTRPTQQVYSGSELRRLIDLALNEAPPRAGESKVERQNRARASENRLLKRGAVLHADIAMFAADSAPARRVPDSAGAIRIQFKDGRRIGADDIPLHWQTARTLLDAVVPAASRDEMVLLWYRATIAQMQGNFQINPSHIWHALQLFPADADLLFFNGCYHELMATAELQNVSRTLPREMAVTIGSERYELREAETYFRRALTKAPDLVEARIRLGRVLGLEGRHADAAGELRLVPTPDDPLLAHYKMMFLGAELEALGQVAEARGWFERAAALAPTAQSPLLALSQLAQREGDRPGAIRALERAFRLPADDEDRTDPWWRYHTAQGRDAGVRLAAMYRALPAAEAR